MRSRLLWPVLLGAIVLASAPTAAEEIVHGPLGQKLDAYMQAQAEEGFSGVLLVARDGEVVISKGYRFADLKNKVPFTSETAFDIGSITKQFTAAAIMRLEMDGKLATDDKITKYFDDVPNDKRGITLHHLLTHTSGLLGDLGDDYDVTTREEVVRQMLAMKPGAKPGERYQYSNGGFSLLGAVVEIASGQPYEQYLREKLFLPAGMHHTGYRLPEGSKTVVAHGIINFGLDWGTPIDKPWADDGPSWNLRANGGILSTAEDMRRWHDALAGDKVLSAGARRKMFTPYVRDSGRRESYYGYGWHIGTTDRGTRLIHHNGGNGIFHAVFKRYVDEDTVVILASNDARHRAHDHEDEISKIIFPPSADGGE